MLLDAHIAFALLGLHGEAAALATCETIKLMAKSGAVPQVLDKTIGEMKRILTVYENHLGTAEGRLTLYQTELTRYFLTTGWSPSDVRELSATLDTRLGALGVAVRPSPPRDRRYTLDEAKLSTYLSRDGNLSEEPRVVHDVDCVASVLTLRNGNSSSSVESCRAIFMSTSGVVIRQVQKWYRDEGQTGVAPIIHQLALSNVIWLKNPIAAASLKIHELIAISLSALAPSRKTWVTFLKHLERLRSEGKVTTDEMVAVVASSLTDPLLARLDDDVDPDVSTITEVVDRVRASYRAEAADLVEKGKAEAEERVTREWSAASSAVAEARAEALAATESRLALEMRLSRIARAVANVASTLVLVFGATLVVASILFTLPGMQERVPSWMKTGVWLVTLLGAAFTVYAGITGGSVIALARKGRARIEQAAMRFLGTSSPVAESAARQLPRQAEIEE